MAMRIRVLRGRLVACCAAKTKEKLGDLYIDDGVDHAIRTKIYNDYVDEGIIKGPKVYR
jgi:hypothetical protein